ncbi:YceI-like domain-containing protein [Reichenbachiella agariperforans]|uniref:YceI-like domain-containing protein n=1 Tax=Reichenbachiella agariperforans TaxID=156994 RepID=A0A1M6TF91_REIAG|nr:YceI family protein [Reichenbachiella agariperforans]SHK55685.1 YceI-like domain-containing protein [Reichenbachiella agariperforans]
MKTKNYIPVIVALFSMYACTPKKAQEEKSEEATKEIVYDVAAAQIKWTAFKLTERVGVSGTFDEVAVTAGGEGTVESVLTDGSFSINTSSVNSNEATRDPKIKESFFGTFNTPAIEGKIVSADAGSGELSLMMNDTTSAVPFSYITNDSTLILTASIDVTNWNGGAAIDSLNSVCELLHKGSDGVSKLWPDVTVQVTIPAKK